jgi:lysophospholipase L1-like esterase
MVVKLGLMLLVIVVFILLLAEIGLRLLLGVGNPLLYQADDQIGYLLAPNQSVRRSGNRIEINQYSMRGPAIAPQRPDQTLRILLLGDSIANGGWWTDQDEVLSVRIEQQIIAATTLPPEIHHTEVLNASANSWGPRNELAYLQAFGSFEAQVILLLINTDDLFATAPNPLVVGRDRNYPDRKPPFALAEAVQRYLLRSNPPAPPEETGDRVSTNLEAIRQIQAIAQTHNAQFLLAMTPLLREVSPSGPRDYELKARERVLEFTQTHQIDYLDFLPLFTQQPQPERLYRDHIHLSPTGYQFITQHLSKQISTVFHRHQ